jgi:hypothetical protein
MVATPTQTVTVDRASNSGNAIAQQQRAGKTIHVPAREVGETLDVRLVDKGSYFEARLVDRTEEVQPRQPSVSPDTSDLLDSGSSSHSYEVRSSPSGGSLRSSLQNETGKNVLGRMSQRKK